MTAFAVAVAVVAAAVVSWPDGGVVVGEDYWRTNVAGDEDPAPGRRAEGESGVRPLDWTEDDRSCRGRRLTLQRCNWAYARCWPEN